MSTVATETGYIDQGPESTRLGAATDPESKLLAEFRKRRQNSLNSRREYEPTWHLCKQFLAGRQWIGWSDKDRQIVDEPNPQKRERHTVNVIGSYHQAMLGKLIVEDIRPDVIFSRTDVESESIASHTRKLSRFAWETETDADRRFALGIIKMLTYGSAAIRCVFDPTQGTPIAEVPIGPDGEPVLDPEAARELMGGGPRDDVKMLTIREGRIMLEALSPFNLIVPTGVEDPDYFPWVMVDFPMWLPQVKQRWGEKAAGLSAQDIRHVEGREYSHSYAGGSPTTAGRLRDHVIVTTGYQNPTDEYPNGLTVAFSENTMLEVREELPYQLKGRPHHGVVFLRYHLIPGRFWGKGIIEDMIGPQRQLNIARSQAIEMKNRNLGRVYVKGKGIITEANKPVGKIMELIELPLHADFPQETAGVPIGPWLRDEAEISKQDLETVAGLSQTSMGQAPPGVSAYAAMQLLAEQDERRVGPVLKDIRLAAADAMLLTMNLAKKYWPDKKQLNIVGEDGMVESFMFQRSLLPPEFFINITKSAPMPTSPAAEAQKIFDLYHGAIAAGQPLPPEWLKDSLDAGRSLPFPKREQLVQERKAEMEHYFLAQGNLATPDFFDDDQIHLGIHRAHRYELEHALRSGAADEGTVVYINALMEHEKMHLENGMAKAQGGQVPNLQGARGAEAQTGQHASMQGAASAATQGEPQRSPRGGAEQARPQ